MPCSDWCCPATGRRRPPAVRRPRRGRARRRQVRRRRQPGAKDINAAQIRQSISSGHTIHPDQIAGRYAVRLEPGEDLSFGTYFNAFPAGYWRRWTVVDDVRLTVALTGAGAAVTVYRSMANGRSQRVDSASTGADAKGEFTFDLPLKPFVDGGWYWYDVVAGEEPVGVEAAWDAEVPDDRAEPGTSPSRSPR